MRTMRIEHGDDEIELAASFAASVEIAEQIADPIAIAREAALEAAMQKAGFPYQPKFAFTVKNVAHILHIGVKHAGGKMKRSEIEELTFDAGFLRARMWAADYLALIVEPRPTVPVEEPEDDYADEESAAGNG